jgi:hypothetical protein
MTYQVRDQSSDMDDAMDRFAERLAEDDDDLERPVVIDPCHREFAGADWCATHNDYITPTDTRCWGMPR